MAVSKQMHRMLVVAALVCLGTQGVYAGGENAEQDAKAQARARKEAAAERRRARYEKRILNAAALQRGIAPHVDKILDCYTKHALKKRTATGELRIELIVTPKGTVKKLWLTAPGVKGTALKRCIDPLSKQWEFETRPGFTHGAIPFFFLRTRAKGAGPTLGKCWNAASCARERRRQLREGRPEPQQAPDKKAPKKP